MNIFIICSKHFYDKIPSIKEKLESRGDVVTLPNCFEDPGTEKRFRDAGKETHAQWKSSMLAHSADVIAKQDAVLVLNFEKNGIKNYIGGATFLEMYDAFRLGKKIFMYHDLPEGILHDEINGFAPILIEENLDLVK